jgi:hypothetical protein
MAKRNKSGRNAAIRFIGLLKKGTPALRTLWRYRSYRDFTLSPLKGREG